MSQNTHEMQGKLDEMILGELLEDEALEENYICYMWEIGHRLDVEQERTTI